MDSSNRANGFLGYGGSDSEDPRKLSFFIYLKNFLFPSLRLFSFTTCISLVDIVLYIITVSLGVEHNPTILLAPLTSTLDNFGMKFPIKEQQGEVWRFITYSILHANFIHIFSNILSQLIIVSMLESIIGWWKSIILYASISIGACLFSSLCLPSVNGVGASASIFGFISAFIGFCIMNWRALDDIYRNPNTKLYIMFFLLFFIFFNLIFGLTSENIDNMGHLGGLIYGFFLIFIIQKPYKEDDGLCFNNRIWYWISVGMLIVLYLVLGIIFFVVIKI